MRIAWCLTVVVCLAFPTPAPGSSSGERSVAGGEGQRAADRQTLEKDKQQCLNQRPTTRMEGLAAASTCNYVVQECKNAGDVEGALAVAEQGCVFGPDHPVCKEASTLRKKLHRPAPSATATYAAAPQSSGAQVVYSANRRDFRCQCPDGRYGPWEPSSWVSREVQQQLAAIANGGSGGGSIASQFLNLGVQLLQAYKSGGVDPDDRAICQNYTRHGLCPEPAAARPVTPPPTPPPSQPARIALGNDWEPVVKPMTESESQRREREEYERRQAAARAARDDAGRLEPAPKVLQYKDVSTGTSASRPLQYKDTSVGTAPSSALQYKDVTVTDSGHPIHSPAIDPRIHRTVNTLFVGGTGVVQGYYVPTDASASVKAAEIENLRKQLKLKDGMTDAAIDEYLRAYSGFDMMIGLGAKQEEAGDLAARVVGFGSRNDQFSNGEYTATTSPLYASLKGTKTARLDCHSNGAMVCLAAISRGDVLAQDVRLFGPQVSPAALKQWQALIANKTVRSVEINLMKDDPIAPMSYRADTVRSDLVVAGAVAGRPGVVIAALAHSTVAVTAPVNEVLDGISQNAPSIRVNVFTDPSCSSRRRADLRNQFFACHDMALYLSKVAPR